jgi:putative ABC transport system ATP-binding protein
MSRRDPRTPPEISPALGPAGSLAPSRDLREGVGPEAGNTSRRDPRTPPEISPALGPAGSLAPSRDLREGVGPEAGNINGIHLRQVVKTYPLPGREHVAIDGLDLDIEQGEFVAVVGRSGSGKTTLLNLLAGIDRPTSGTVQVAGASLGALSESELAGFRAEHIGLVFQFFQLLPTLTVLENVMLPMDFARKVPVADRPAQAQRLLARVGIEEQADKFPATLSGGQQQRAAIARALANDPPILLADEPTGNLDSVTADAILQLLAALHAEGRTIVVVTHERDIRSIVKRELRLADGRVVRS